MDQNIIDAARELFDHGILLEAPNQKNLDAISAHTVAQECYRAAFERHMRLRKDFIALVENQTAK